MGYDEQLSAAKFRAERDLARQELDRLRKETEAMRPRLMPEGCEWISYDTGEPVPLGGEVKVTVHDEDGDFDRTFAIRSIKYEEDGVLLEGTENEMVILSHGERVKRPAPKALDAEGVEIREKCDVWWICEGDERGVHAERLRVETIGPNGLIECSPYNGGRWVYLEPSELYVNEPVLAADEKPLEVGQTVWDWNGDGYVVERIYSGTTEPDFPGHTVACHRKDDIVTHMFKPSQLTHQRPVLDADGVPIKGGDTVYSDGYKEGLIVDGYQHDGSLIAHMRDGNHVVIRNPQHFTHTKPETDTWERIEEDVRKLAVDYWGCSGFDCNDCPAEVDGERPSKRFGTVGCVLAQYIDLVRRAKKLAGVE